MRHGKLLAALIAAMAVLLGIWLCFKPEGTAGNKNLAVQVVYEDGSSEDFQISTDAEFLGGALIEAGLIEGEEGPYGLYITTVGGVTAGIAQRAARESAPLGRLESYSAGSLTEDIRVCRFDDFIPGD